MGESRAGIEGLKRVEAWQMQVRWTTPAAQDLEEITNSILKDSSTAAETVARKLFDASNSLESLRNRGRAWQSARDARACDFESAFHHCV